MTISFSSSSSNIVAIWSRDVYRFLLHMIFFVLVRVEIILKTKKRRIMNKTNFNDDNGKNYKYIYHLMKKNRIC
jgi:hypothetical protein